MLTEPICFCYLPLVFQFTNLFQRRANTRGTYISKWSLLEFYTNLLSLSKLKNNFKGKKISVVDSATLTSPVLHPFKCLHAIASAKWRRWVERWGLRALHRQPHPAMEPSTCLATGHHHGGFTALRAVMVAVVLAVMMMRITLVVAVMKTSIACKSTQHSPVCWT